jgi:hypothetical protein
MSDEHVRALRDTARRTRGRLADYRPRAAEGAGPAANRRAHLERSAARAAASLAAAESRRRRGGGTPGRPTPGPSAGSTPAPAESSRGGTPAVATGTTRKPAEVALTWWEYPVR